MNRLALTLTALGAPGLVLVGFLSQSELVPTGVAPAIAGSGGLIALAGAATSRPRVHGGGVALAVLGASLTGVAVDLLTLAIGVGSIALVIGAVNVHLELPSEAFGVTVILAAVVSAVLVAGIAVLIGNLSQQIGGGGIDARGGLAAWVVILVAVSWGLTRWAREATPE